MAVVTDSEQPLEQPQEGQYEDGSSCEQGRSADPEYRWFDYGINYWEMLSIAEHDSALHLVPLLVKYSRQYLTLLRLLVLLCLLSVPSVGASCDASRTLTRADVDSWGHHRRLLNLSNQCYSEIDQDAFTDVTAVVTLNLNNNALASVPEMAFSEIGDVVERLELDSNLLTDTVYAAIQALRNLQYFSISDNKLRYIAENDLVNMSKAKVFNFANNSIETVHGDAFKNVSSVNKLDLSGNRLESILKLELSNHPDLTGVDLRFNKIRELDLQFYCDSPVVARIRVTVDEVHLELKSGHSVMIHIGGNNIGGTHVCDCCDKVVLSDAHSVYQQQVTSPTTMPGSSSIIPSSPLLMLVGILVATNIW